MENNLPKSEGNEDNESNTDPIIGKIFFSKYKAIKKLGEGSFGKIYSAVNINNQQKFALKMVIK